VCGFDGLDRKPYAGPDMQAPSYEICPSCGYQFGFDDDQGTSFADWRAGWISNGMRWWSERIPPEDWNPGAQLENITGGGSADDI